MTLPPREPISVLHIVDSLAFGGVQTILKELFEFQPENPRVFLFALRTTDRQVGIEHANVRVYPRPGRFSLGPLRQILGFVREHRIQVIHCHLFRSQVLGYVAALILGRRAVRLVFHEHGSAVAMESGNPLERIVFRWFQTIAAPRVNAHIAISRFVEQSLEEITQGRLCNSVVLYNPARCLTGALGHNKSDRTRARKAWGAPADAFVVGMAGRIVRRKGWRDFLVAISLLAERFPLFFLIAGDGPEFQEMTSEIAARNLASSGRVVGYLDSLSDFYAALDCFVMPSHWEPAGLSHLEAQYLSIPVVACDIPGLNETVQGDVNCLLCKPNDPVDMAGKISTLVADPTARHRIGQAGRLNAEQYSIANYTERLNSLYQELTQGLAPAQRMPVDRIRG